MSAPIHCDDVRELVSAVRDGNCGLTELVLAASHVRECSPCLKHVEQLQQQSGRWRRLVPASTSLRLAGGAGALLLVLAAYQALSFLEFGEPSRLQVPLSESALPSVGTTLQKGSAAESADRVPPQSLAATRPPAPAEERITPRAKVPRPPVTVPESTLPHQVAAEEAARDRPPRAGSSPALPTQLVPPSTDVLGRLTVKDRGEAERRLA
jgi:hypothetical protein